MEDVHPIRVWRVDKRFRPNLDAIREIVKKGRKKFPVGGGLQFFEAPLMLNLDLIDSFESLQGDLYKHGESQRFFLSFLKFWDHHRQVFEFDPRLAEALSMTDIDDVPWSALRLPHPEFYLSLGDYGQETFAVGDFEYVIDGAYVRHVPQASVLFPNDSLLFHFTARLIHPSYREARKLREVAGYHYAEPHYEYCISGAGCTTIGEAIARGEAEYLAHCDHHDTLVLDAARALAHECSVPPFGERLQLHRKKFERGRTIIRSAIAPLFNAIFYLVAQPEHRELRFPKGAPATLARAHSQTKDSGQKKTVLNQLAKKGFSQIVFVRDPEISSDDGIEEETGRHVRAHWRRGHWRNQAYGLDLTLRRWVWIRPVLVRPREPYDLGSIHKVKDGGVA